MEPRQSAGDDAMTYARQLDLHGSMMVSRPQRGGETGSWTVEQDDEYANLPAHYLTAEEALDRVEYLRSRNVEARVAALMAEPSDDVEEFEADRDSSSE